MRKIQYICVLFPVAIISSFHSDHYILIMSCNSYHFCAQKLLIFLVSISTIQHFHVSMWMTQCFGLCDVMTSGVHIMLIPRIYVYWGGLIVLETQCGMSRICTYHARKDTTLLDVYIRFHLTLQISHFSLYILWLKYLILFYC